MKNLYILFFLIISGKMASQDLQNAHWALADFGGIHFTSLTTTTNFTSNLAATRFSSASVSDQSGNLLFYTDGSSVWDGNHSLMVNGVNLLGVGADFTQNIVIIPDPLDVDAYYIITISQNRRPGQQHGLRSTRVNVNTGIDIAERNIPLHDNLNVAIDDNYPNNYGKITTAKHSNGLDYWLIAQVGDNIYSFLVDHLGIHNPATPLPSPILPNFLIEVNPTSTTNSSNGPMKISPNDDKILIGYSAVSDGININQNAIGRVYEGFFDNTTGVISLLTLLQTPFGPAPDIFVTGAEFGPDNETVHRFYENASISSTIPSVGGRWLPEEDIEINDIPFARGLQRAIDRRIYFENSDFTNINPEFMGVINSPDSMPYDLQTNVIDCGTVSTMDHKNIPPWVQWQPCRRFLTTANPISGTVTQERAIWIKATNLINNAGTDRVVYHAGNYVELNPGFETQYNSKFAAYVQGCTEPDDYIYKEGNAQDTNGNQAPETLLANFKISPNPSSNFIDLSVKNDTFNKILIVSMDGKIILDRSVEPTSFYNLDVTRYASGVYLINVISVDGKQYSQKLIKN